MIENERRLTPRFSVLASLRQPTVINYHDRLKHAKNMLSIAKEMQLPLEEIEALYERVLVYMSACATVTDYLYILVPKKVKAIMYQRAKLKN